ncbi:MAG TPA: phospholipid scramblase-related protein [Acidimicrobiales bacterium]|jgi:uncharacterized protein YxjI|nr:phospholipid scramblase-related protein [Acidimicrobiales bacterium]
MSDTGSTPPNWYPDPSGRHELRYYDGTTWTEHVSSSGRQSVDPIAPGTVPAGAQNADKVQQQVAKAGVVAGAAAGGGSIFTEPVLVVNQKAKLIEINNEYAIYDQNGTQIGAVRQVGQSAVKKAVRMLSSLDQFMTHSLQIVDMAGTVQLTVTRPAKVFKSRFSIGDGTGQEIGQIVQKNMIGKIRFGLEASGQDIGSLNAENWRAWDFSIQDAAGTEVARIKKTWEGLAKTMFTTADNYVVQIHRPLAEPLRSCVIASALSVDTALKQDKRGFN